MFKKSCYGRRFLSFEINVFEEYFFGFFFKFIIYNEIIYRMYCIVCKGQLMGEYL